MTALPADDPVLPEEWVLRRIHRNLVDEGRITRLAFCPTKADVDGISLYREKHISPIQLDAIGRQPGSYFIARLQVQQLLELGLSVVPTEEEHPGHVSIPELSADKFRENERQMIAVARELSGLAQGAIVLQPAG